MSKVSVPTQIQFILNQKRGWMIKQDIVDLLMLAYKNKGKKITSDYITRALRTLAGETGSEKPKIARREDKKGLVWYAPLNTEKPVEWRLQTRIITRPDGSRAVVIEKVAV